MSSINSTKIKILRSLFGGEWWTTSQVADECELTLSNASELLRRYNSQGLVSRQRNYKVPRGYLYRITNVGLERLRYLNSDVVETSSVITNLAGLSGNKKLVFDRWVRKRLGGK